jgi:hypothetical protein
VALHNFLGGLMITVRGLPKLGFLGFPLPETIKILKSHGSPESKMCFRLKSLFQISFDD